MPSGPKKRRASRRKQAEAELASSTPGATESCGIGLMETNDAVQLSQQVEELVSNTLLEPKGNFGRDVPKENDGSAVPEVVCNVVACGTCLSEVAVENEIGSMETDIAAEVSNVQEHVIDVQPSTESPALKKLCNVVQVDQEVEEHGLHSEVMGLVDGEDGNVHKEIDSTKSNEGVAVPELEVVSSEIDGIVVGDAQLASKKDDKDIESFTREETDLPSPNGGCMSVEQADNCQDVGLNQENHEAGFDVIPLKKLNDADQVSQQVEQHKHQDSVIMELLNGDDGNVQNENGCFNGGFSLPEVMPGVEELAVEKTIEMASKKDEKHCESVGDDSPSAGVGDDSALTRNFAKLLDLVEQIELLVQESKGLIRAQQKEQIKCEE
nr:hypothetical protein Itr_chr03CG20150 [Ipomoea trifida]